MMLRKLYVNNNKRALCEDLRNNVSTPTVAGDRQEMNRVTHTSRFAGRALTRANRQKPCAMPASEKHDNCIIAQTYCRMYWVFQKSRIKKRSNSN